jgi:leader peptidase (prepilin peptidase)/N-methyltransferase
MVVGVFFGLLCLLSAVLAWIDIRHGIIPDWLNLTIAALGLSKAVVAGGPLAGLEAACEGAAIGAVFWLLRRLYFAPENPAGPGHQIAAAAGIWVGVAGLPMFLMVAALPRRLRRLMRCPDAADGQTSMSFGPFLDRLSAPGLNNIGRLLNDQDRKTKRDLRGRG